MNIPDFLEETCLYTLNKLFKIAFQEPPLFGRIAFIK